METSTAQVFFSHQPRNCTIAHNISPNGFSLELSWCRLTAIKLYDFGAVPRVIAHLSFRLRVSVEGRLPSQT